MLNNKNLLKWEKDKRSNLRFSNFTKEVNPKYLERNDNDFTVELRKSNQSSSLLSRRVKRTKDEKFHNNMKQKFSSVLASLNNDPEQCLKNIREFRILLEDGLFIMIYFQYLKYIFYIFFFFLADYEEFAYLFKFDILSKLLVYLKRFDLPELQVLFYCFIILI